MTEERKQHGPEPKQQVVASFEWTETPRRRHRRNDGKLSTIKLAATEIDDEYDKGENLSDLSFARTAMDQPVSFVAKSSAPKNKLTPGRRIYRPGFNSYLKVILDDLSIDKLHQMALDVHKQVDERFRINESSDEPLSKMDADVNPSNQRRKRSPQPFRFKARSHQSLHMTLFFGGETLCELPPEELIRWHGLVKDRLRQSSFLLSADTELSESEQDLSDKSNNTNIDRDYWFRVVSLCVFPPRRNNLVVAILEASPAWHTIHDDLRSIAIKSPCPALAEITKSGKATWTPHITLGNLLGGNKSDVHTLSQLLQNYLADDKQTNQRATTLPFTAVAQGISMGGPTPSQATLDWNFLRAGASMNSTSF